jgi:MscS family membrane protein
MAKEKIDNMGARPARRIRHYIGITCDTPTLKIQQYTEHLRYYLTQQPQVIKEDITIHFTSIGDYSLQLLVQFFAIVDESSTELQVQEDFLFEAKNIADKLAVNFAYPTQTLQISKPS